MSDTTRTYAHMCRDQHVEIGHNDSSDELCPLCRAINERDAAAQIVVDHLARHFGELAKACELAGNPARGGAFRRAQNECESALTDSYGWNIALRDALSASVESHHAPMPSETTHG